MKDQSFWRKKNIYYHKDVDKLLSFVVPVGVKQMEFRDCEIAALERDSGEIFDYIVLNNVIGSLQDIQETLTSLHASLDQSGRLVLIFHNYLWEPVFNVLEFLGLKHKPGRQNWLTFADVENFLLLSGFETVKTGRRMLFPLYIPLISAFINSIVAQLPIISRLCMTQFIVARPISKKTSDHSVSIVVPARNEKGNIESVVKRIPNFPAGVEIIFVEGHSKDDTWEEILRVADKYRSEKNIVVTRQDGMGKGDAVRKGFGMATGEILMILDADMSVAPEDLYKFYLAFKEGRGDFINGSRMIYPMEKQAMRFLNTIANKFFASAFSWILSQRIKDTLCGTKVLLKSDYERIVSNRSYFGDFDPFGDFDLIFGAAKLNMKIVDLPIRYRDRTYGTTQIQRFRHGWLLFKMMIFAVGKFKFNTEGSGGMDKVENVANEVIAEHFDDVATNYDYWKDKNWYYYSELKSIARDYVRGKDKILDIGCGTGTILRELNPARGLGIDISEEMVEIAKRNSLKYKNLSYLAADIIDFKPKEVFDGVLFFDVVEHVPDTTGALRGIRSSLSPNGIAVISMANPYWEPILMLAEKLGLKMPEGPHNRIPAEELISKGRDVGLELVSRDYRLIFPKYIPVVSRVLNNVIGRLPFIRRLSVIEVFIFKRKK